MILRLFFRRPNISVLKENKNIKGLIKAYKLGNANLQSRAVIALGEIGDSEAVKPLIRGLKNNNYLVTKYTIEALTKIGDLQILEPFISILIDESYRVGIKMDIATALTNIGQPAIEPLCSALEITKNIDIQIMIIDILGKISDENVIKIIFPFLKNKDHRIRESSYKALVQLGWIPKSDNEICLKLLANEDWDHLKDFGEFAKEYLLIGLFDMSSTQIRKACSNELVSISHNLSVKDLLPALQDKDFEVRKNIVEILGNINNSESRKYLERAIFDESEKVRVSAIHSLGKIGDDNVITLLKPCLKQSSQIQDAAIKAIGSFGEKGEEVLFECIEKPDLTQKSALQLFDLGEREKVIEKLLYVLGSGSFHGQRCEAASLLKRFEWNPNNFYEEIIFLEASESYEELLLKGEEGEKRILSALKNPETGEKVLYFLGKINKITWGANFLCQEIQKSPDAYYSYDMFEMQNQIDYYSFNMLIKIGLEQTIPCLIKIQNRCGTKDTATTLLNCGNSQLSRAAETWAEQNGYRITYSSYRDNIKWGSL